MDIIKAAKKIVDISYINNEKDPDYNFYLKCKRYSLNEMEGKVARLVADAKPNKEIGEMLNMTEDSIKKYVLKIRYKTGFVSRVEVGKYFSDENSRV